MKTSTFIKFTFPLTFLLILMSIASQNWSALIGWICVVVWKLLVIRQEKEIENTSVGILLLHIYVKDKMNKKFPKQ